MALSHQFQKRFLLIARLKRTKTNKRKQFNGILQKIIPQNSINLKVPDWPSTSGCDGSYQFLRAAGAPVRRRGAAGAPAARNN